MRFITLKDFLLNTRNVSQGKIILKKSKQKPPLKSQKKPILFTPLPLFFFGLLLALFKLWLISGQTFYAVPNSGHDDYLFLGHAKTLLDGHWLGPFNNVTLAKGMFYPLFIASTVVAGISLFIAQHLLYILACCLFVLSVNPLVQKPALLFVLFVIQLFNPVSYTNMPGLRVIREGIYPALTIMVVGCAIGLMVRGSRPVRNQLPWAIGLGLALSAFWLTREEGVWMLPSIIALVAIAGLRSYQAKPEGWIRRLTVFTVPFVIFSISLFTVAAINKAYYGIFSTSEFKWSPFLDTYGALTRVNHLHWNPKIPVPKDVRVKLYEFSPSFAELKTSLEGPLGQVWIRPGCDAESICDDLGGGWFVWAFRDAVAAAGYYKSGESADNYYRRLSSEINTACDNKKLDCGPMRSSFAPPWHSEYALPLVNTMANAAVYLARFKDLIASSTENYNLTDVAKFKINILTIIGNVYQLVTPLLFLTALAAYIGCTVSVLKKRILTNLYVVNSILLIAIAARLFLLSLIEISSFPAVNTLYLAPAYPLLLIFITLSLFDVRESFFSKSS